MKNGGRKETRIGIRSGGADDKRRVKVAVVSDGFLWLGASPHDGIAWISGRDTLRKIRDALTEMLDRKGGGK